MSVKIGKETIRVRNDGKGTISVRVRIGKGTIVSKFNGCVERIRQALEWRNALDSSLDERG